MGIDKKQLKHMIEKAQERLYNKLINLDIPSLNLSEYNQRYLGKKVSRIRKALRLYGYLLRLSLQKSPVPIREFVLVDYGGGSGVISLLAKEMGVGTVIYTDIYDVSCGDVKVLSESLGLALPHIVCGDVDEVIRYLQKNSILINTIMSYDVLEHIYDVESHFRKLSDLQDAPFRVLYASGANIENRRYTRKVAQSQNQAEYERRENKWGHKERDTLESYLEARKKIIAEYAPELCSETVERLARSTRGLIQKDILACVDEFRRKGSVSHAPDHPTNTCDPYTGNWCEHLMAFEWLEKVIRNASFSARIRPGRFHHGGGTRQRFVNACRNGLIQVFGRGAMPIAPYYIVEAEPTLTEEERKSLRE